MTVKELIEELSQLPQDLPVVTDFSQVTKVSIDKSYYLDKYSDAGYVIDAAVVLE